MDLDFAVTTTFDLEQVTESFVRLRAYGLDPTNGLLRTLGDTAAGRAVGRVIGGLVANIAQFVAGLIALPFRIASGAAALGTALVDAIWTLLGKVRDLLPFSDAKRGPLSRLTAAGSAIVETMGQGILQAGSAALVQPLVRALRTVAATPTQAALAASAPSGISINQLIINQQPGEDAEALADKFLQVIERRGQLSQREALYDDL